MTDPVLAKDSVLTSTKKVLGIDADYTAFDLDITLHINTVLGTLYQLGVGLANDQTEIEDSDDTWQSILTSQKGLVMIKSYVYLRVRQLFDPPATGFVTDSFDRQIKELEWRITVAASSTPNLPNPVTPPTVYPGTDEAPSVWDLTGGGDFPEEAPINAVGIDFSTGKIFRKTDG